MTPFRAAAVAALLLLIQQSTAFVSRSRSAYRQTTIDGSHVTGMTRISANANDNDEDPTKGVVVNFADAVQNILTNSPLKEGKKALVKSLAGKYDEAAVRARINGLVTENPVLMLSFRT